MYVLVLSDDYHGVSVLGLRARADGKPEPKVATRGKGLFATLGERLGVPVPDESDEDPEEEE